MRRPPRPTYATPGTRAGRRPRPGQTKPVLTTQGWVLLGVSFSALIFWLLKGVLTLMGHPYALDRFTRAMIAVFLIGCAATFGLHLTIKNVFTSLFDFGLAGLYLFAWLAPGAVGESRLSYLFWLVPVEFVAISCAFGMTSLLEEKSAWNQIKILGVVLGLIGSSIVISSMAGHWWPLAAVVVLGANQILSSFWDRGAGRSSNWPVPSWFLRWVIFLMLFAFLSEWELHKFGWTDFRFTIIDKQSFSTHSVIAFGFFYFLSAGLYEMTRQAPRAGSEPAST